MLTLLFPKIRDNRIIRAIRSFMYSDIYIAVAVLAMVCSNVFGMELVCYYTYLLFVAATAFLCEDCLPVMPLVCCGYMTFSRDNNPALFVGDSLFYTPLGKIQLFFIAACMAILLVGRFIFDLTCGKRKFTPPKLTLGFAAIGVSYLLAGAFSGYYASNTVVFGFVQLLSLCLFYFFFSFTVDWNGRGKEIFARIFSFVGIGIVFEIFGMYVQSGAFEAEEFNRGSLFTGWGVYNNVGCVMAMCVPAPFYLSVSRKNGWIFNILGNVFYLAVVLTQSRGSILMGGAVYVICFVLVLWKSEGRERLYQLIVYIAMIALVVMSYFIWREEADKLFASIFAAGMDDAGRFEIYEEGIRQFKEAPLFGNGFYECHTAQLGNLPEDSFLPPRYHNTYVQLLASGGIVALAAYLIHRLQTVFLIFRRRTTEKYFIGLCVLALILTSLLDCHFFNFGPGLLYSVLLVCAEHSGTAERVTQPIRVRERSRGEAAVA